MERMTIETAEALWRLEKLPGHEIPEVACEALKHGHDGPALRELAGMYQPAAPAVADLFEQALKEMRRKPLTKYDAGMRLARDIAEQMLTGEMNAYDGACEMGTIWVLGSADERFAELEVFVNLVNEYENYTSSARVMQPEQYEKLMEECEFNMLLEAQALVAEPD